MLPPSSSTSNSDQKPSSARPLSSWKRVGGTAAWFVVFLGVIELAVWILFTKTPLAGSALHRFLWYGTSYEAKLRELVETPNLSPHSVLYAGWLDKEALRKLPSDVDVTIYGMSFSANLAAAMKELRPDITQRNVGGPGAPLSHTYGIYQVDRELRKTRVAVIGVTSAAVQEVTLMNRGSLFTDSPFPYFFPRFKMEHGAVVRVADSLINSASELRTALVDDPALWERQLAVLAANDAGYHRFFFASDPLDASLLGRFIRRGLSKNRVQSYSSSVYGSKGFRRESEAVQLFRGLLKQMIHDLREENVAPVVVLFTLQGYHDDLYGLVADLLRDDGVPYVNTFNDCRSDDRANYAPDMHFVHGCDLTFAKRTLDLVDAAMAGLPTRPAGVK